MEYYYASKRQSNKRLYILILIFLLSASYFFYNTVRADITLFRDDPNKKTNSTKIIKEPENIPTITHQPIIPEKKEPVKTKTTKRLEITDGMTFGALLKEADVNNNTISYIYQASKPVYDLAQIRLGYFIDLIYDINGELQELIYKINSEDILNVKKAINLPITASSTKELIELKKKSIEDEEQGKDEEKWIAERTAIPYEIRVRTAGGIVESSMYEAAIDNDIDIRAIIELANAFQWSIDFALDPRKGDTFKFIFEERYLLDEYKMPGKILAGRYVNSGVAFELYYFEETEKNKGYFDKDGNSVQKMFLKAPVAFQYISSGFTTGRRYIEAFNVSTGHRAIDYAAPYGTPIRSVGDGRVMSAGWSTVGYGNLTKIRHNGTYSTNYAHQSKMIVGAGQRVKQGQIIGYVGSTGFSTGPHLHYEMIKNGLKINPLREVLPPGQPIKGENKERFLLETNKYKNELRKK